MKKQNVETIVLKNAKTGVAEKIQHECHNTGYDEKRKARKNSKRKEADKEKAAA